MFTTIIKALKGKKIPTGTTSYKKEGVNHIFVTKDIKINGKNLGKYKVTINRHGIIIKHNKYDVTGYKNCHPHVSGSGSPCLGDYRKQILEHKGDVRKIIETIVEFLHNYTSSDSYETLSVVCRNVKGKKENGK